MLNSLRVPEPNLGHSPWGPIQRSSNLEAQHGVTAVYTASHGGIKVDAETNLLIPDYMRVPSGWYEEDCDWCLPVVALHHSSKTTIKFSRKIRAMAYSSFLRMYTRRFTMFFNVKGLDLKRNDVEPGAFI